MGGPFLGLQREPRNVGPGFHRGIWNPFVFILGKLNKTRKGSKLHLRQKPMASMIQPTGCLGTEGGIRAADFQPLSIFLINENLIYFKEPN